MRILIAHEAAAGGGGVESYLAAVMPALRLRGHQLLFLSAGPQGQDGPTRLDAVAEAVSVADTGLDAAMARAGRWKPDVCFSHNMRPLEVDVRLMDIAPVVKMMHGYFGTCISGLKSHAFPGVCGCSRRFGAACLALYLPRRCGPLRPGVMFDGFAWASRQRRLFPRYAHVVVASRHMAGEYARHGIPPDRLTAAPLFATVAPAAAMRPLPADPTVLFLGRMTNLKGGDVLIRAVARARAAGVPVRIDFAGTGPSAGAWQALASALGVPAVFHGWVSGDARIGLLRRATVLAVPSLWPEPFGLVGLEAAAHGVPSVAFDVGGIGDWLKDDVNGRLVREAGSAAALGRALADLLRDDIQVARLGRGALESAAALAPAAHLDVIERLLRRAAHRERTVA